MGARLERALIGFMLLMQSSSAFRLTFEEIDLLQAIAVDLLGRAERVPPAAHGEAAQFDGHPEALGERARRDAFRLEHLQLVYGRLAIARVGRDGQAAGQVRPRGGPHQLAGELGMAAVQVVQRGDMLFGNHQNVHRGLWVDVLEREHGVGLEKRAFLGEMYGARDLDWMRRLRRAMDPGEIANRGKMLG